MRQKPDLSAQPSDSQVGCDSFILAPIFKKGEVSHVYGRKQKDRSTLEK